MLLDYGGICEVPSGEGLPVFDKVVFSPQFPYRINNASSHLKPGYIERQQTEAGADGISAPNADTSVKPMQILKQ